MTGTTTYRDNTEALDRRFGTRLAATPATGDRVRARPMPEGLVVEVDAGDGAWRRLVSARDPMAEAGRWADEMDLDGAPAIVLVGSGLGYILDVLEARGSTTRVVVLEPDPDLAHLLLARRDWRTWIDAGRLAVLAGPDYDGIPAVARLMDGVEQAPVHVLPSLGRSWPDPCRAAAAAAGRLRFEAASNAHARRALAGRYLRQTLANAARLAREADAAALEGLFPGVPAVIVAAGPSLDRNVRDLHLVRDRALIVACDTALRPLLSLGIEPQLVVAIDPSVANACHLGALHEPSRTWLAAEASLHPPAFTHFDDRTFFFRVGAHAPWPWLSEAGLDRLHVGAWGSVITSALDLVQRMGCGPILFAGADLAFTDDRPYCRGTTLEAQWASWVAGGATYEQAFALLMDRWPVEAESDVNGRLVRTAGHLVAFRDWMTARVRQTAGVRFVNTTGAGILHGSGIEQATAAQALAACAPLDPDAVQARLAHAHGPAASPVGLFEHVEALASRGWELPDAWTSADPTVSPGALRAALEGPEYTAWRLGRAAARPTRPSRTALPAASLNRFGTPS